ncbi:putative F-box/FBD/LRR-repeat protein At4g03220 [Lactuca sativa]|uniref:F-box domain-containing protein n=1 Tax=Lactuca sativa TaxID=4236 RepID=A0A9R1XJ58_LACSA|nr:putative F-box/FBD/LRR-repeat protein At4g03220 [Lactuca sativa]KAJ0215091.1 hypothetical protein LSAT_V11C300111610 [Lactuca sativa]
MEFDRNKVGRVVKEDRLSSLPDELIHNILSSFDMKFVVQTCLLSSRWKLLWTSMPCLNFTSWQFTSLPKFAKFVNHVLSHHNHQVEVSSVKLHFSGAASHVFVRKIAKYAFSHNVQQLTITSCPKYRLKSYHASLFSSHSLKHFTLTCHHMQLCTTTKAPLDFPALTTLRLSRFVLCSDLFSNCVNLKNLTLEDFSVKDVEVFDIITPRLSSLRLAHGSSCSAVINLIAPQLEKLTVICCSFKYLNAPPGLSSFDYWGDFPLKFCKDRFYSLNKVSVCFNCFGLPYKEKDAIKTINLLQELHSAKYLTLNVDIVKCISSFPDLLLHHASPFSNLISLTIDYRLNRDEYGEEISTEARNFLLENSPSAALIMKSP